jgi:hypothetical protein
MSETTREAWDQKVDFAAKRLADWDGRDFERLPEHSRWFASKVKYRHRAALTLSAGNLWDMAEKYREITAAQ